MTDTVRVAQYFKVHVSDKPGEGSRMLGVLREAGVNLLAFSGFPRNRKAQLDFVPADPVAFKSAAKQARWKILGPKTCFLVEGDDRIGAGADLMTRLAESKINVTAIDATCSGQGRYGAICWVKPRDVKKAARVLGIH